MKYPNNDVTAILTYEGFREAGSANIDGKDVKWEAGHIIGYIQLGDKGKMLKSIIMPDRVEAIVKLLDNVNWGTVVTLHFNGKYVSDVEIVLDWADQLPIL